MFLDWLCSIRKPTRRVMLIDCDGDTKIVKAHETQSGWIANWWWPHEKDKWSILLPDGKTAGYVPIKRWLPHSGWDGTEFGNRVRGANVVELKRKA